MIWKDPNDNTLSVNEDMQANDRRFLVRRPFEYDWNMKISNVKRSDQGVYKCILLTNPVKVTVVSFYVRGNKGYQLLVFGFYKNTIDAVIYESKFML